MGKLLTGGLWVSFYMVGFRGLTLEMTTGLPPFYSENTNLMYKKILHNQLIFPPGFSERAQSLVSGVSFFL